MGVSGREAGSMTRQQIGKNISLPLTQHPASLKKFAQ